MNRLSSSRRSARRHHCQWSLTIKIDDWHGLHRGFTPELEPGFTALVGPNGAGKTTLLEQIRQFADQEGIDAWEYSNLKDGGSYANSRYALANDFERLATVMASSEGECVAMNFGSRGGGLGPSGRPPERASRWSSCWAPSTPARPSTGPGTSGTSST